MEKLKKELEYLVKLNKERDLAVWKLYGAVTGLVKSVEGDNATGYVYTRLKDIVKTAYCEISQLEHTYNMDKIERENNAG